jgi:hypothetical protein
MTCKNALCGCENHNPGRTVKVVYNACFGGFGLSKEAQVLLGRNGHDMRRDDSALIEVVEKLGKRANGSCADLRVETVTGPYRITEYDGAEEIETPDSIEWENT